MIDPGSLSPRVRQGLRAAYWAAPSLFCLWLYWYGLRCWFQQDDFAWLQLRLNAHSWGDVWRALFEPSPHGTFRPLSERAYFLVFSSVFGLQALPFRLIVFATQFGNLVLLSSITRRLTGSRAAGLLAPLFWLFNVSLVIPMTWNSAYMQVLCGFCLLLGFHFFLRYVETERRLYYWLQWIPFLTGFLVMETTIVYPAIVAAYALLCARKYFRSTLPLFLPSAAFGFLHMWLAPKQKAGVYSLYLDGGVFQTFLTYWKWVFDPRGLVASSFTRTWLAPAMIGVMTLATAAVLVWAVRRRHWFAVFFAAWYLVVLSPVLPLRGHVSMYYLTLPAIGIAMLLAYGFAAAWRAGAAARAVAAVLLIAFTLVSVRAVRNGTWWCYARSQRFHALADGIVRARQLHPQDTILLSGVDSILFWGSMYDGIFTALGVSDVFLAPGSEKDIEAHPELAQVDRFVMQPALVNSALKSDRIVVYDLSGTRMRAITETYRRNWDSSAIGPPRRLEPGSEAVNEFLGPTWWPGEGTHRWMPKSATARIAGPQNAAEKLYLKAYCPKQQVAAGPLTLQVSVNGKPVGSVRITRGDDSFEAEIGLPADTIGRPSIEVGLEVNRTIRVDDRELGLAFTAIGVR